MILFALGSTELYDELIGKLDVLYSVIHIYMSFYHIACGILFLLRDMSFDSFCLFLRIKGQRCYGIGRFGLKAESAYAKRAFPFLKGRLILKRLSLCFGCPYLSIGKAYLFDYVAYRLGLRSSLVLLLLYLFLSIVIFFKCIVG